MTQQEQLAAWLNDAQMMEEEIIRVLESHVADAEEYPEMQQMIKDHLQETREHANRVKARLEEMDADVSGLKSGIGALMGKLAGPSTEMMEDKAVKNAVIEYATEHLEMACYRSILSAAELLDDDITVQLAQEIYDQEKAMATRIEQRQPGITKLYLESLNRK